MPPRAAGGSRPPGCVGQPPWSRWRGPLAPVGLVVLAPVAQLAVWSAQSVSDGLLAPEFGTAARNSLLLAVMSIALVVGAALLMAYGRRVSRSATAALAVRVATIGYGVPGSVVAVAVLVPLGWIDHRLDDAARRRAGPDRHRDLPCSWPIPSASWRWRSSPSTPGSSVCPARSTTRPAGLGSDRLDVLARIHVPLVWGAMATAGLLVFTEVMRELPATLLLRPLGGDTLAVAVWQATTESLYPDGRAAGPADRAGGPGPRGRADPPVAEAGVSAREVVLGGVGLERLAGIGWPVDVPVTRGRCAGPERRPAAPFTYLTGTSR